MTHGLLIAGASLLLGAGQASVSTPSVAPHAAHSAFDRSAWQSDFTRLKQSLAQGYANLDWQIDHRGLKPAAIDRYVEGALAKAESDVEAALLFARLIEWFDDPHLRLEYGPAPNSATLLPRSSQSALLRSTELCSAANYRSGKSAANLLYDRVPGWRAVGEGSFAAGRIGTTGFIQIPAFGEDRYPAACAKVARAGLDGRALQLAVRKQLNAELKATIGSLKASGIERLVIDVRGNGGGSEWSETVAAMLTGGELVRMAPRRAAPTCDRSSIWKGERPCSIYADAPKRQTFQGTGVWTGPLAVLIDNGSASATEEFVTLLKGSKRAAIVGKRTFGSGCGYIDGGHAFVFQAAKMHVMMPNCSRYTADGINEIEGIAPDIVVEWAALSSEAVPNLLETIFAATP